MTNDAIENLNDPTRQPNWTRAVEIEFRYPNGHRQTVTVRSETHAIGLAEAKLAAEFPAPVSASYANHKGQSFILIQDGVLV